MKILLLVLICGVSQVTLAADDSQAKRDELVKKLDATAVPRRGEDGKIGGFQLVSVVPGSVYEQLGLQSGDVIVSANGNPVNSIKDVQQVYSTDVADLVVRRNGKEIQVKKPLSPAASSEPHKMAYFFDKATDKEKSDPNFLKKISLAPTTDPKTGKKFLKVLKVEKGSVFEREGLNVGDLLLQ